MALLKEHSPEINSLRDVSLELLDEHKDEMDEVTYMRCSYVIEENMRLEAACEALLEKNFEEFGKQMYGSHYGLKDKYEVSCPELDQLVVIAEECEGVIGARMMGGGFGGCTINLVRKDAVDSLSQHITNNYQTPQGEPPLIIIAQIEQGVHKLPK